MPKLRLDAGNRTDDLIEFISTSLDDEVLDEIEIDKELAPHGKVASEPLTVAATVTLGTTAMILVARLIERWLENQRQREALNAVAEGFKESDEAGRALARVAEKHNEVSVEFRLAELPRET